MAGKLLSERGWFRRIDLALLLPSDCRLIVVEGD